MMYLTQWIFCTSVGETDLLAVSFWKLKSLCSLHFTFLFYLNYIFS